MSLKSPIKCADMGLVSMFWFLYAGTLSMLDCNIFTGLDRDYLETEVNMFLLPLMENEGEDALTKAGQSKYHVLVFTHFCLYLWMFSSLIPL